VPATAMAQALAGPPIPITSVNKGVVRLAMAAVPAALMAAVALAEAVAVAATLALKGNGKVNGAVNGPRPTLPPTGGVPGVRIGPDTAGGEKPTPTGGGAGPAQPSTLAPPVTTRLTGIGPPPPRDITVNPLKSLLSLDCPASRLSGSSRTRATPSLDQPPTRPQHGARSHGW
jgi:hypothetical protein